LQVGIGLNDWHQQLKEAAAEPLQVGIGLNDWHQQLKEAAAEPLQVGIGLADWHHKLKEVAIKSLPVKEAVPIQSVPFLQKLELQSVRVQSSAEDDDEKPWPFLVEYTTPEEMESAIQSHLDKHRGAFVRFQMPEGPVQGQRLATRWLEPQEWEMTCHLVDGLEVKSDKVPVCHRAVPGDRFGITCLRYHDPTSNSERCRKLGVACHRAWNGMCHLSPSFVVKAAVASELACSCEGFVI